MAESQVRFSSSLVPRAFVTALPQCLTAAQKKAAVDLCVQSKSRGQSAAAGFGFGLGAADPLVSAMTERACDWAKLPLCPVAARPVSQTFPGAATTPSALSPEVLALKPPPIPQPKNSGMSPAMLGGVVAGILLVGGVFYFATRKAS